MRKHTTALTLASVLVAGLMIAPSLYAESTPPLSGSMMGNGTMMGNGMMGDSDSKGDGDRTGNMMGMMKMMNQMSQMMDHCNNMMSDSRPNDQWRKNAPSETEKKR